MPAWIPGVVVALVAVWVALIGVLYLLRPRDVPLRELARLVPDIGRLIRDLLRDAGVPGSVRLALFALLAWLVSPVDLVPEFVPVLGPVDDIVVTLLVLRHVGRRLGLAELRRRWRGSDAGFALLAAAIDPRKD